MKTNDLLILFWFIFLIMGIIGFTIMHEKVHVQINEYYGVDSKIEYFEYFPNLATVQTDSSQTCNDECMFLHSLNEIVGYPLLILMTLAGIGIFLFLAKEEETSRRKRKVYIRRKQ